MLFGRLGVVEVIIIAVILLVLFGGKKLPELGRGIGETIKELRKAVSGGMDDDEDEDSKK